MGEQVLRAVPPIPGQIFGRRASLPAIHLKSPDCYGASSAGVRTILLRIRNPEIVFAPWASSAVRISMTNCREAAECILKGCSSDWVVAEYADRIPMEQYLPEKSGFSRRALCAARMPVLWSHIRIREKKRTAVLVKEAATLGTSDRPTMILDYANSRPQIIILALRATSYRAVRSLSKTFALTWRLAMTARTFVGPSDSLDAIVKSWACLSCISITPLHRRPSNLGYFLASGPGRFICMLFGSRQKMTK